VKKHFYIFIFLNLSVLKLFSQNNDTIKAEKYFDPDQIVYEINYDYWLEVPEEIKLKIFPVSSNIYLMFPLIGTHSHLSLASGIGFGASNIKTNAYPTDTNDISFYALIPDSIDYKNNKLTTTYLDIPIEFRFMSNANKRGRSFKVSLGFKAGVLIGNHTKYHGEDLNGSGNIVKYKNYHVKNLTPYRYGFTARIGYGKFFINGYYSLTGLFEKNKGQNITPVSIGLTIIPY